MNLGCLHAGDNPNRICGHAELQIDLRLLPGMDSVAVLDSLRCRVEAVAAAAGTEATLESLHPPVPAFETAQEGPLVQLLSGLSGNAPGSVSFGTEAHFYQCLGAETVVFGPGSIDQAHQPNEFLARNQVGPAQNALEQAIAHYCL